MFKAKITITLRPSILDPQGKAVQHAMETLHLSNVKDARIGKFIELNLASATREEAEQTAEMACKKILANPVMEDYAISIEQM